MLFLKLPLSIFYAIPTALVLAPSLPRATPP